MEKFPLPPLFFIVIVIVFLSCCGIQSSDSGYKLITVIRDADLDYTMLNNIDSIPPPYPAGSTYQIGDIGTVKGAHTVYKFMRQYEGPSKFSASPVIFHDLLAVKVDASGVIVDAYKYTLEWTDSPSLALYRLGSNGVRFKTNIDIDELQLTNPSAQQRNKNKKEKPPITQQTQTQKGQTKE